MDDPHWFFSSHDHVNVYLLESAFASKKKLQITRNVQHFTFAYYLTICKILPPKSPKQSQKKQHGLAFRFCNCIGLAYQGKDIVFRLIIECSSLREFWLPLGNNNNNRSIFLWGFLKDDVFGLCWNLRLVIDL